MKNEPPNNRLQATVGGLGGEGRRVGRAPTTPEPGAPGG